MKPSKSIHFFILFCLVFFSCKQNPEKTTSGLESITKQKESNLDSNSKDVDVNAINKYLPLSTTDQIIYHDFYTLSYNEKYEQAEWVAYHLDIKGRSTSNLERPFFIEDPKVSTHSANWKNYKNSGYDKGHLCPAGDMKISKKAFDDTFYTSNISPQLHEFNDGVWNRLEQKARYWSTKYDGLYIVTGGVLNNKLKTIGKEKVAVPEYFYKILLRQNAENYSMIAFLIPNKKSELPLYSFVVSVDAIEQKTGIDFFPTLEDKEEAALEKSNSYKEWSFE